MIKVVSTLEPLSSASLEECERYYVDVHSRYVRMTLRDEPGFLSYHTNQVISQYDIAGGWARRPRIWRIAVARLDGDPSLPGRPMSERMNHDHRHFLRNYRYFQAAEDIILDRLRGQTALAKYSIHIERHEGVELERARRRAREQAHVLLDRREEIFGLRLVAFDDVKAECVTRPLDEPGQLVLRERHLPATRRVAHVDLYFDHVDWAREFFADARASLERLIADPLFESVDLYELEERTGLDRRL